MKCFAIFVFELQGFTMLHCVFFINERCFYWKNNYFLGKLFVLKNMLHNIRNEHVKINFHLRSLHLKGNP